MITWELKISINKWAENYGRDSKAKHREQRIMSLKLKTGQ